MLNLQIDDELEAKLAAIVAREHTTPELLIQKWINQYSETSQQDGFFAYAGLWQSRDITQESLREQAWHKTDDSL